MALLIQHRDTVIETTLEYITLRKALDVQVCIHLQKADQFITDAIQTREDGVLQCPVIGIKEEMEVDETVADVDAVSAKVEVEEVQLDAAAAAAAAAAEVDETAAIATADASAKVEIDEDFTAAAVADDDGYQFFQFGGVDAPIKQTTSSEDVPVDASIKQTSSSEDVPVDAPLEQTSSFADIKAELLQGLTPSTPQIPVAAAQLPPPQEKLDVQPVSSGPQHQFVLPLNRVGQAPVLRPGPQPKKRPITPAPLIAPATAPPPVPAGLTFLVSAPGMPKTLLQLPAMMVPAPPAPVMQLPARPVAAPATAPTALLLPAPTAPGPAVILPRPVAGTAPLLPAPPAPGPAKLLARPVAPPAMPPPAPLPPAPGPVMILPRPVAGTAPLPPAPPAPQPSISRFTQRNRRKRAAEEKSGVVKRKYVRAVTYNICSLCGQPKNAEFGHSRTSSATFCSRASGGKSVEDWLAEQKGKK
ncbi:uncharacterized protein LOC134458163 [Engraulis encrasicolus]|uniref:uncharacterized protein LOC134458163 n=1 Tax=Engraulis encrasicolus TaxID=184585 RepID=UPI002FD3D003